MKEKEKYQIKFAETFWEDLYEISKYLSNFLYPYTIINFNKKIFKYTDYLKYFPKMYVKYENNSKYRRFLINNYIVFYKVDDKNKIVNIVHIYYSRKNSFNLN